MAVHADLRCEQSRRHHDDPRECHLKLKAACAAVLDNAGRQANAINAVGIVGPPGSVPNGVRGAVEGTSALRLVAATVLHNAQLAARGGRVGRASDGADEGAAISSASVDGGRGDSSPVQQEPLPVLTTGEHCKWRPGQVQVLVRYVSSLPAGTRIIVQHAAKALGYELWMADRRAKNRFRLKLIGIRRRLDHGRDPMADHDPATQVRRGTYNWRAWLRRAFRALPNMTGTVSDAAAVLQADPEVAPKLDRRPDARCRSTPIWKGQLNTSVVRNPEFVKTGQFTNTGYRGRPEAVHRFDEEVARLQLGRRTGRAPKRGTPGLPQLGKMTK